MKNNLKIFILLTMCLVLLCGCGKKEYGGRTIVVNGTIISNEKVEGYNSYKNVVQLEDGEIWEHISPIQLVQLDREQQINKGDPKDLPNVVVIRIAPIGEE